MTNFVINLPYHKRWVLPNARYQFNSVIHGETIRVSVIDTQAYSGGSPRELHIAYIDITKSGWEDLYDLAQDLARKRYPAEIRHKSRTVT